MYYTFIYLLLSPLKYELHESVDFVFTSLPLYPQHLEIYLACCRLTITVWSGREGGREGGKEARKQGRKAGQQVSQPVRIRDIKKTEHERGNVKEVYVFNSANPVFS